jgi:hypothetical protein
MIKGPLNTYDYRFGDNVNSFIKLVSFISIEYKTVKVESAESVKKTLFFEFNGYKSDKRFGDGLTKSYDQAIDEIEETLLIDFRKYERLNYVSSLLLKFADVKTLLSNDSKIGYKHKNLKYSNAVKAKVNEVKVNDESYYQEYYTLIDQYLNKIIQYLKVQKHSHGMLVDSEIPMHKNNTPAPGKSTKDNPIKFFQYITTKRGVSSFLNHFKPTKLDFSNNDIVYNDITKIITYNHFDVEHGKHSTITQSFNDYLTKRLKVEFQISKLLIEEHFRTLNSDIEASFFLKRTLNDLKTLAKNVEGDKDAIGYADIKKVINVLIKHFNSNYAVFITPGETKNENSYFQLKGLREAAKQKAINLHDSLVYYKYLEKNSRREFVKLFTGQQTSDKIEWLGNKNELKLLINLLIEKGKIKNCKSKKWLITAANFKSNDANFSAKQLKDAKSPINKTKIENIVSKISH